MTMTSHLMLFTVDNGRLLVQTEKLNHADLDQRALDALKEFPVDGALAVLKQFLESNLVNYWEAEFLCENIWEKFYLLGVRCQIIWRPSL
jgi:hypothetical protein